MGLGNPGPAYKRTRHNAGAMVVERLVKKAGLVFKPSRSLKSLLATGEYAGNGIIMLLPQTFMNLSGEAVAEIVIKKQIALPDILVVYDDIALTLGKIRLKPSGSSGGHNGVESVIDRLGSKDFARLRLGVGPKGPDTDMSDYVLSKFCASESGVLNIMLENAVEAIKSWICDGICAAMNNFNQMKPGLTCGHKPAG